MSAWSPNGANAKTQAPAQSPQTPEERLAARYAEQAAQMVREAAAQERANHHMRAHERAMMSEDHVNRLIEQVLTDQEIASLQLGAQ